MRVRQAHRGVLDERGIPNAVAGRDERENPREKAKDLQRFSRQLNVEHGVLSTVVYRPRRKFDYVCFSGVFPVLSQTDRWERIELQTLFVQEEKRRAARTAEREKAETKRMLQDEMRRLNDMQLKIKKDQETEKEQNDLVFMEKVLDALSNSNRCLFTIWYVLVV